jgi:hypothetical protein
MDRLTRPSHAMRKSTFLFIVAVVVLGGLALIGTQIP